MKNVFWSGILAGIVVLICDFLIGAVFQYIFPALNNQYMTGVFRPWSDWRMQLYFLHPFIIGLLLSYVWSKVKILFTDGSRMKKGCKFGAMAWVLLTVPGMFVTYASFTVSAIMVLSWTVSGLIGLVLAGKLLAKMNP